MRPTILLLLTFSMFSAFAQNYTFTKNFVNGVIIFKDSTQKSGQVKWFPHQNEKLKFRETEKGKALKYSPEDILGFTAGTVKFVSLYDFDAYADAYVLFKDYPAVIEKIKNYKQQDDFFDIVNAIKVVNRQ